VNGPYPLPVISSYQYRTSLGCDSRLVPRNRNSTCSLLGYAVSVAETRYRTCRTVFIDPSTVITTFGTSQLAPFITGGTLRALSGKSSTTINSVGLCKLQERKLHIPVLSRILSVFDTLTSFASLWATYFPHSLVLFASFSSLGY